MSAARNAPLRRRRGALDPDRLVPRSRRALRATAVYAALVVLALFILLPIGWMLTAALKPDTATIFTFPPEFIPPSIGGGRTSSMHSPRKASRISGTSST